MVNHFPCHLYCFLSFKHGPDVSAGYICNPLGGYRENRHYSFLTAFTPLRHIPLGLRAFLPKTGLLALCQSLLPRGEVILFVRSLTVDMEPPTRSLSSPGHRAKQQRATKVVETLLGNGAFRYLSICSVLFASSVNSLIPPAPQFNVV